MPEAVQPIDPEAPQGPEEADEAPRGWWPALVREVRDHPFAYAVLGAFLPLGPLCAYWLFPEAPLGAVVIGGLAFSGYAALCAVPGKFL